MQFTVPAQWCIECMLLDINTVVVFNKPLLSVLEASPCHFTSVNLKVSYHTRNKMFLFSSVCTHVDQIQLL